MHFWIVQYIYVHRVKSPASFSVSLSVWNTDTCTETIISRQTVSIKTNPTSTLSTSAVQKWWNKDSSERLTECHMLFWEDVPSKFKAVMSVQSSEGTCCVHTHFQDSSLKRKLRFSTSCDIDHWPIHGRKVEHC